MMQQCPMAIFSQETSCCVSVGARVNVGSQHHESPGRPHPGERDTRKMDPELLNLPLTVKIPVAPGSKPVFFRGKLGEKLPPPYPYFNLDDPYLHQFSLKYNCLHDPSLRDYHKRKDILRMLKKQGVVTCDNKVVCTVKDFNEYRQYLTRLKLEAEQILGQQEEGLLSPLAKLKDGPKLPGTTTCWGKRRLQPQKSSSLPPPKSRKSGGYRKRRAALDEGQIYSRDHSWKMEMMAKELVATVLEILRDHLASSTPKASEPGVAAGWKELPIAGSATQADKSKDTETATAERTLSQTSLDTLTREVFESVHCTLESFVTPQFEQDTSFEYAEILELPGGNVSNRQLRPSQTLPRQATEAGQGLPRAYEQQSLKAMLPATAEGAGYAKTMEPEDCATVKKNMERKMNLESTALASTLDVRTMANQIADSVLERVCQPGPAPAPEENFQGSVANPSTCQGRMESCAAEDTLPSVDP
ncbi:fibrous sheath-interacting protein 2 isoform X3 [Corvus kubaryi]|uniref:fibrous sheath-interacting protein 2 isoform X3 n=1 Tax=Corvus kubaryi TaxID=68294 RepID=UPI001C04C104|nr:fibrous sheath-interacting protein 2 isoform X3 [Corvus kubaryi]